MHNDSGSNSSSGGSGGGSSSSSSLYQHIFLCACCKYLSKSDYLIFCSPPKSNRDAVVSGALAKVMKTLEIVFQMCVQQFLR